jgi:hypothetical protein
LYRRQTYQLLVCCIADFRPALGRCGGTLVGVSGVIKLLGEQRDQWCTEAESMRKGCVDIKLPSEEQQGINAEKAWLKALIKITRQILE